MRTPSDAHYKPADPTETIDSNSYHLRFRFISKCGHFWKNMVDYDVYFRILTRRTRHKLKMVRMMIY